MRWRRPAAIVNDRPVLSSDREPHINKPVTVWIITILSWAPDRCLTPRQTGRLTAGRNVILTLTWVSQSISRSVTQLVRGLLRFSRCELLSWETVSWGMATVREPRRRGTSAVGSPYQKTGEDTADWKDLSVSSSELYSVWLSETVIITCSHGSVRV
jgi:hypothetical protein